MNRQYQSRVPRHLTRTMRLPKESETLHLLDRKSGKGVPYSGGMFKPNGEKYEDTLIPGSSVYMSFLEIVNGKWVWIDTFQTMELCVLASELGSRLSVMQKVMFV